MAPQGQPVDPLTNCSAPFTQSGGTSSNNGNTETITIPVPSDYCCNYASFGGCWYQVNVTFQSGGSTTSPRGTRSWKETRCAWSSDNSTPREP